MNHPGRTLVSNHSPSSSRCFKKDGSVTAGNAPGLNDGASALVVTSLAFAKAHGLTPKARVTCYATGGGEPKDLFFAPILAVQNLMKKAGTSIGQYDLIEANEAFAVQAIADGRALGLGLGSGECEWRGQWLWGTRSAPAAPGYSPPSCTRSRIATRKAAWQPCASAAGTQWRSRSKGSDLCPTRRFVAPVPKS